MSKEKTLVELFDVQDRAGVPLIAGEVQDQPQSMRGIKEAFADRAIMKWTCLKGLVPLNDNAISVCEELFTVTDPASGKRTRMDGFKMTGTAANMLRVIYDAPKNCIVFMCNAQEFTEDPMVMQGINDLRDRFEGRNNRFIMLAPSIRLGEKYKDVKIISEPLPNREKLEEVVKALCSADPDNPIKVPEGNEMRKVTDLLSGLSAFTARQTLATSLKKGDAGLEIDMLELQIQSNREIEQTDGLKIGKRGLGYAGIGGLQAIKDDAADLKNGPEPPNVVMLMDEGEKTFGSAGTESSGTTSDNLQVTLKNMADEEYDGYIFHGWPGAGKTAIGRAIADEANAIFIEWDGGAMTSKYVGESQRKARAAWRVVNAKANGRALIIMTTNKLEKVPPELVSRFTLGITFFGRPTREEKDKIWPIHIKRYNLEKWQYEELPDDTNWTGREIMYCCRRAYKFKKTCIEAAIRIVPMYKSNKDEMDRLCNEASDKYLSASYPGTYKATLTEGVVEEYTRKIRAVE